jgi:putative IMPACT (imprinted ancient) family translation regulator
MSSDEKQAVSSTTLTPGLHDAEMEVKKSRFIGYAQHVTTWKEAQDFLGLVKAEHPKSRHIAYGFLAGCNPVQERCSDDGEPTGTAGLPVLGELYLMSHSKMNVATVLYLDV